MTVSTRLPEPLIPLHTSEIEFDSVGGKSANLVALATAGFEVPNAFLIPTSAYREFVSKNQLTERIDRSLNTIDRSGTHLRADRQRTPG